MSLWKMAPTDMLLKVEIVMQRFSKNKIPYNQKKCKN